MGIQRQVKRDRGQYKIIKWDIEGHKNNRKEQWVLVVELNMTVELQRLVGRDSGTTGALGPYK